MWTAIRPLPTPSSCPPAAPAPTGTSPPPTAPPPAAPSGTGPRQRCFGWVLWRLGGGCEGGGCPIFGDFFLGGGSDLLFFFFVGGGPIFAFSD